MSKPENMPRAVNPPLRGMALKRAQREKRKSDVLQRKKPKLTFGTSFKPSGGTLSAKGHARTCASERTLPSAEGTVDPLDALLERVSTLKYKYNPYAKASAASRSHARMDENSRPFDLRVDGGPAALPIDWTLKSSAVLRCLRPITSPSASAEAECDAVLLQRPGRLASTVRAHAHAHAQNLSWEQALMYYVYPSDLAGIEPGLHTDAAHGSGLPRPPLSRTPSSAGTLERTGSAHAEHAKTKARARARAKPAVPLRPPQHTDSMNMGAGAPFVREPVAPCAALNEPRQFWESALRSAYLMLRFGHADCFYLVCPTASTVILFGRSGSACSTAPEECLRGNNAGCEEAPAAAAGAELFGLLSPLGPALRSALRDADVGFELIEHKDPSASVGLSAGVKHGTDSHGTAVFAGASRCHALYEFLLNQPIGASSGAGEAVKSIDPLIVAPCPFMLSTVRSLQIDRRCVQVSCGSRGGSNVDKDVNAGKDNATEGDVNDTGRHVITLRGFILPGAVRQLCAAASELAGDDALDMHFHADNRTQPFAVPHVVEWYSKWARSVPVRARSPLRRSEVNDEEDRVRVSGSAAGVTNTGRSTAVKNGTAGTVTCATTGIISRVVQRAENGVMSQ